MEKQAGPFTGYFPCIRPYLKCFKGRHFLIESGNFPMTLVQELITCLGAMDHTQIGRFPSEGWPGSLAETSSLSHCCWGGDVFFPGFHGMLCPASLCLPPFPFIMPVGPHVHVSPRATPPSVKGRSCLSSLPALPGGYENKQ